MSSLTPREESALRALSIVTNTYDVLKKDYDKLLADHNQIKEQLATMTDKINKLKDSYKEPKSDIVIVEEANTEEPSLNEKFKATCEKLIEQKGMCKNLDCKYCPGNDPSAALTCVYSGWAEEGEVGCEDKQAVKSAIKWLKKHYPLEYPRYSKPRIYKKKDYFPKVSTRVLTQAQADAIRNEYKNGFTIPDLYKKYKVKREVIASILLNKTYVRE